MLAVLTVFGTIATLVSLRLFGGAKSAPQRSYPQRSYPLRIGRSCSDTPLRVVRMP